MANRFNSRGPSSVVARKQQQPVELPVAQFSPVMPDGSRGPSLFTLPATRIGINGQEVEGAADAVAGKGGNMCTTILLAMGFFAFLIVAVFIGIWVWRSNEVQSDLNNLNNRLKTAEALLVNHTGRLTGLDSLLATTIARVTVNEGNITSLREIAENHEGRITSLEGRTTALEGRMTDAEAKLLGIMNNVTTLQGEMLAAQQDIAKIYIEIGKLQQNATDHENRIRVLEVSNTQNVLHITQLFSWLQGNLTVIDARLDQLNTTYTVTAYGNALVTSGYSIPSPVTWQTRHFTATGGVDVEYLWISDSMWTPTLITANSTETPFSFHVSNFTSADDRTNPTTPVPMPTLSLDRPLTAYQKSKFLITSNFPDSNATVISVAWNNTARTLDFKSDMRVFDAVTIVKPLTFIIGFL